MMKLLPACSTGVLGVPDADRIEDVLSLCRMLTPYVNVFELRWPGDSYKEIGTEGLISRIKASPMIRFCAIHGSGRIGKGLGSPDPVQQQQALDLLKETCRVARAIGAGLVVPHLWEPPHDALFEECNLVQLPTALRIAKAHGVILSVEGVPCTGGEEQNPLKRLLSVVEVAEREGLQEYLGITLDMEFLASSSPNLFDAVFEKEYRALFHYLKHVHVKDYAGQAFVDGKRIYAHPGEGILDLPGWFARLRETCCFTFLKTMAVSLESPAPGPDIDKLAQSLRLVSQLCMGDRILDGRTWDQFPVQVREEITNVPLF